MYEFDAMQRPVRIRSGLDALDALPRELDRLGASRALVVCGRSVAERSGLIERLRALLGDSLAGVYAGLRKDAPVSDIEAAAAMASERRADVLLAIGAGSVIKAARVIAMCLAERAPLRTLCTQYGEGAPPVSPKLLAPKLPIVNILTAATSAQNRGGSALKDDTTGERLEFFDPKTRPAVIFWDAAALMTAPAHLVRSTGFSVYWRALMNLGSIELANPLVEGDRKQAYALARRALRRAVETGDYGPRIDLCAAALLQNRDEDDGGRPFDTHRIARVVYALAAPIFHRFEAIDQASTHAALTPAAIRVHGHLCPDVIHAIGQPVGQPVGRPVGQPIGCKEADGVEAVAQAVSDHFASLGMPTRLRDLGLPRAELPHLLAHAGRNFNADRAREFIDARERTRLANTLDMAW